MRDAGKSEVNDAQVSEFESHPARNGWFDRLQWKLHIYKVKSDLRSCVSINEADRSMRTHEVAIGPFLGSIQDPRSSLCVCRWQCVQEGIE